MNDESLNNLIMLWKKLDGDKTNKENENKNGNLVNVISRYKENSNWWVPPNFAKLPIPDYNLKSSSKEFSMMYNEEKRNHSVPNVNILFGSYTN